VSEQYDEKPADQPVEATDEVLTDPETGETVAILGEPTVALDEVAAAGGRVVDVGLGEPTLEDVFIDLTGRGLR